MMEAVFEQETVDFERASEILADDLNAIGPYGKEDVAHLAEAWEAVHGRPLWLDEHESIDEFRERAKKFKSVSKPKTYSMDRNSAREALNRLREVAEPSEQQQHEINDLEDLLDERRTDFGKPRPPKEDVSKKSRERFLLIQAEDRPDPETKKRPKRAWQDRVKLVERESDIGCLHLCVTQDDNEQVRDAATKRLAQLEATGR